MTIEKRIFMKPIGLVRTGAMGDEVKDKTHLSHIILDCDLTEALQGITDFSHLYVLFFLDKITKRQREKLTVHPRGRRDLPLVGVFSARTNLRPNPIGLTLVELLSVESNILTVRGLDAFDGTPVLDIKPFDFWDIAKDARVPEWWLKLEREKK